MRPLPPEHDRREAQTTGPSDKFRQAERRLPPRAGVANRKKAWLHRFLPLRSWTCVSGPKYDRLRGHAQARNNETPAPRPPMPNGERLELNGRSRQAAPYLLLVELLLLAVALPLDLSAFFID